MKDQATVKEIVREYLVAHGFDGLYSEVGQCGCSLDDLMMCEEPGIDCRPGYKTTDPSDEFLYLIGPQKEE